MAKKKVLYQKTMDAAEVLNRAAHQLRELGVDCGVIEIYNGRAKHALAPDPHKIEFVAGWFRAIPVEVDE